MPLVYLLYRCPKCGQDPLDGEKDNAICSSCGTRYSRGPEGGLIQIQESSGEVWEVPGHRLTLAMEGRSDVDALESAAPETLIHTAQVEVKQTTGRETPVRWGGKLLGFAEAMGEPTQGTLQLTGEALILFGGTGEWDNSHGGDRAETWPLLDIRAVQTSSSSLQFSPSAGGLVQFKFTDDSPFRWETLLRNALRRAYRREGMGEIVEFQPRIVAE